MAGRINVNTEVLRAAAQVMNAENPEIESTISTIKSEVEVIGESWKDTSSVAKERYVDKMNNVANEVTTKLCPGITGLASTLNSLAARIDEWNANH